MSGRASHPPGVAVSASGSSTRPIGDGRASPGYCPSQRAARPRQAQAAEPDGWPGLIAWLVLASLAMLGISLAVLLDDEDRALWRARFQSWRGPGRRGEAPR